MNDLMNWFRNNRYLPYMLMIVFVSFILWNFWGLTDEPLSDSISQPDKVVITPTTEKDSNIKNALEYPLFGVYLPEGSGEIKASSLDIKVVGIMLANEQADSHVLIELANNEQKIYKVGDELPGGAQIKKITNDGLLIWYNNRLERISLPSDELEFNSQAVPLKQEPL